MSWRCPECGTSEQDFDVIRDLRAELAEVREQSRRRAELLEVAHHAHLDAEAREVALREALERIDHVEALWRSAEAQAREVGDALMNAIHEQTIANGNRHRVEAENAALREAVEYACREFRRQGRRNSVLLMEEALAVGAPEDQEACTAALWHGPGHQSSTFDEPPSSPDQEDR